MKASTGAGTSRSARLLRRGCFAAAAVLAAIGTTGIVSTGIASSARADTAPPSYSYSTVATALGVRTLLDSNPEPSPVPDLTDVEVPYSEGQLDSYGTVNSTGHLGNLNGLGQLPGLLCQAGVPCSQFPGFGPVAGFPPPDPLAAAAHYPTPTTAHAPVVGSQQLAVSNSSGPLTLGAGNADASVTETSGTNTATSHNTGIDGAIGVGSVVTTTTQKVTASALTTHAESTASGITIGTGNLIGIKNINTVTDVTSDPTKAKGTDVSNTTISGVTVLGQPATIDQSGVHVTGAEPGDLQQLYQNVLNAELAAGGVTLRAAGISVSDDATGHTVQGGGLIVGFSSPVNGIPNAAAPPAVTSACSTLYDALIGNLPNQLTSNIPVYPCAGVGLNPNGVYFGSVSIAQIGVISLAQPGSLDTGGVGDLSGTLPSTGGLPSGTTPSGTGTTPAGTASTGAATTAGSSGTSGGGLGSTSAGSLPGTGGGAGTQPPPAVAGGGAAPQGNGAPAQTNAASVTDGLSGLSGRLLWFFPALILAMLGLLAGRLLKAPSRLPGAG